MNKTAGTFVILVTTTLMTITANPAHALLQDDQELGKQAQNPLASLISLPVQNNTNFGLGPNDRTQNVVNIQPVVPFGLGSKVNLITRTIFPFITQPDLASTSGSTTGLGDVLFTAWLSPAEAGKVIWGVGPVISLPIGKEGLSTEKWGLGPSVVALIMPGPWVVGALVNNIWSVGGDENLGDVNQMTLQYFVNYNFPSGWYLTTAPIITANWEADDGNKWTVPLGGGFGKVFRLGSQPFNANTQAFYNVVTPDVDGAKWQLRLQLQALFPK
ncbi:MAG: neuromedin U [Actinomycetota bacterium]|nr:neuromedin U [Actinomycetota bacterium]